MLKVIAFLLIGAVPGAVVTWSLVNDRANSGTAQTIGAANPVVSIDESRGIPAAPGANPLPGAYRAAAEVSDPFALATDLVRAMGEPFSIERNATIEASFKRLAELDLRRALQIARAPGFDASLVVEVFRAWAESNRDGALAQLATISDPEMRMDVAVALLDAIGDDAAGIERIAQSLPEVQRIDFQAEALAERAKSDPDGALSAALALGDPAARNTAAQRIGIAWTRQNPLRAIARAETMPPELRTAYRDSVAVEWARVDVPGFLAYADSLPTLDALRAGMAQAMAVDPNALFEIASRHPPVPIGPPFPANITVERTAFTAVVQGDPEWGVAYLETMTDPQRQASFRAAIAETWGRTDPEKAMAWARSLDPPQIGLQGTIVWSASMVDIDMSIDWMLDFENQTGQPPPALIAGNLGIFVATDPRRTELANRLRALPDDPAAAQLLNRTAVLWVQTDPEGMLDWMLDDGPAVDSGLVANIAGQLATRDPALAASYLDRMPPDFRGIWLQQVAGPYALLDPGAAADWIERFRNEPEYESVMQQVVQVSAQTDPAGAGRMLKVAPENIQVSSSASVASAWAQQDLAASARWAVNLPSPQARSNAVNTVASTWATRDPQAAQRWALNLPRGAVRDGALTALVSRFARPDFDVPIDDELFAAFDSDQARLMARQRIAAIAL